MSGYEVEQDEILVALSNTDFLEQVEDKDNIDSGKDIVNPNKGIVE